MRPRIVIATPATAAQNNGNWRTAVRWRRMLARDYEVEIIDSTALQVPACHLLLALHARRSAQVLRRFRQQQPRSALALVLTGTDVYRDIHEDAMAAGSVELADRLVVLQPDAINQLAPSLRPLATVIFQSAPTLVPSERYRGRFDLVQVGHLRAEKDPFTPISALRLLPAASRVRLTQIGAALDQNHRDTMAVMLREEPRLAWTGMLTHARTRQRIKRAHLLVIASRMEGGAHVIAEAVCSGVPVIASRVGGNVGMLGEDYAGYFPVGDAAACASLMSRAESDKALFSLLAAQCDARRPLFGPEREAAALRRFVAEAITAG